MKTMRDFFEVMSFLFKSLALLEAALIARCGSLPVSPGFEVQLLNFRTIIVQQHLRFMEMNLITYGVARTTFCI